jgi:hypothetical protein
VLGSGKVIQLAQHFAVETGRSSLARLG